MRGGAVAVERGAVGFWGGLLVAAVALWWVAPNDVPRGVTEGYKVWIAGAGVALVAAWHWLPARLAQRALVVLTLLAAMNYARFGTRLPFERVDVYDMLHYYLNARYFEELGYEDLYPACILADHENGGPFFDEGMAYMAQDAAGHHYEPIAHALARGRVVRTTRFTPERWEAFERDFLVLQRETEGLNDELWRQMIQDHGFNGTPVWTALAEPLARVVPPESIKWLGYVDVALLAAALGVVGRVYGASPALWCTLFLLVGYSLRWPTVSWVYLRYDWLAALLLTMALLKRGAHRWAGVTAAWAATLRLFPALWMYGPFAKGVGKLVRGELDRRLLAFGFAFVLGVGALEAGAIARFGPETVETHFSNMWDHNRAEQLSSRRIGLALAIPFRGELLPKNIEPSRKAAVERQQPLRYGIAALVLLMLGWGLRSARDDEAYGFGFLPFFLFTTASYYYYVARVTLALLHASDLSRARNRVGLAWLLGLEVFTNWAETTYPGHRVFLIGYLAWGLAGYALVMTGWILREAQDGESDTAAPPPVA